MTAPPVTGPDLVDLRVYWPSAIYAARERMVGDLRGATVLLSRSMGAAAVPSRCRHLLVACSLGLTLRAWAAATLATGACGRLSSQVVRKGPGDMPVIPELRLALRLAWPWIPGRAARTSTADPGLPLRCPFFHRQMCRDAARAGVGGCLHEFTLPLRVRPGVLVLVPPARLQTAASGTGGPVLRGQPATAGDLMIQA